MDLCDPFQRGQLLMEFAEFPQGKQNVGRREEDVGTKTCMWASIMVETLPKHLPQLDRAGGVS